MARRTVRIQLLLRERWRTPEGFAAVRKALESLDMRPTASGAATVSAIMDAEAFEARFGPLSGVVRFETDTLATPQSLVEYVESVSVAPRPTYMRKAAKRPKH